MAVDNVGLFGGLQFPWSTLIVVKHMQVSDQLHTYPKIILIYVFNFMCHEVHGFTI